MLVFDNGAEQTILTEAIVTRLHLKRDRRHTGNTVGIGGEGATLTALVDDFALVSVLS
jgi:hypothetical protein